MKVVFPEKMEITRKFVKLRLLLNLLKLIFYQEGGNSGQEEDENEESQRDFSIAF